MGVRVAGPNVTHDGPSRRVCETFGAANVEIAHPDCCVRTSFRHMAQQLVAHVCAQPDVCIPPRVWRVGVQVMMDATMTQFHVAIDYETRVGIVT